MKNDAQSEYLRRVDRRIQSMLAMINVTLILAKSLELRQVQAIKPVDFKLFAGRIQRTVQDEARRTDHC